MPLIVAVGGGSGSGKTFLAKAIRSNVPAQASILSYDSYYKDQSALPFEKRAALNYDSPDMLDAERFVADLKLIRQGKTIQIPQYDFKTHSRTPLPIAYKPTDIVIVEGIMVLTLPNPKAIYDFMIYVDADDDIRLARRVLRDIDERGRTAASVIDQYMTTVRPMHKKYVAPTRELADFVFVNNDSTGIDETQMKKLTSRLMNLR